MSSFTLSSPRVANYQTSASALRMLIKLMAIIAVATTIAALLGGCASREAISTDYGSPFSMLGELLASEQPSSLLAVPVDDNAGLKTARREQDDNRSRSLLLGLGGMCAGPFALLYR